MGLLKLLGWNRQKPLRDLTPDIRAYTSEVVAANLDEFRRVYWQFVVGNTEKAHAQISKTRDLAQGDWVVVRSFWLAKVARHLQARAAKELKRLGGESRTYYGRKLEKVRIEWGPQQFADALCLEHGVDRPRGLSAQDRALGHWAQKATPHMARTLWDYVTKEISVNVGDVMKEVDLDSKFFNALVGQVGGSYYYEMVSEIVRWGQLDFPPERFRHTVLNPKWIRDQHRVR
ncbi:MAG: hypothetical protein ACYTGE_11240 [Planctomycetota bacterium]|jgi:hypothetical protein